jgi:hypothetical protein
MQLTAKLIAPLVMAATFLALGSADAASHREAPLIAMDPAADNTDVYAFVSYDADNLARAPADRRVTFIMNVNPGQDPADAPNYYNFADDVLYRINVDNDEDGKADNVVYEIRFKTENRPVGGPGGLTSPVPYLGNPHIPAKFPLQGITALDGPGSEGLTRRQTYTVTEIRNGRRRELFQNQLLIAVPSNVGPATMPDYPALAAQGIYTDQQSGIRVFAGQRAETFYIDLGAVFDTLNLRRYLPLLTGPGEDTDFVNPFGVNRFSGSNISTIAIEVPIRSITSDGEPAATTKFPVIGMFASTARHKVNVLRAFPEPEADVGPWVQVSRMANPLVDELIITTPNKDKWNAGAPENEAKLQSFYQNPVIATELSLVYNEPIMPMDGSAPGARTDLLKLLLKYPDQPLPIDGSCGQPCAELLRLDLRVPPTAPENQSRLGEKLSNDKAGYPNGRRPNDDVTDITIRVAGGLIFINNHAGDGVNFLANAPGVVGVDITANGIAKNFPFLPTPYDGKNRRHVDCDETGPGANPCGPLVP